MKKIWILFIFFSQSINAQTNLHGLITNEKKEALAFVNILINGDIYQGVSTDINGAFKIETETKIDYLLLTYVGYENLRFDLNNKNTFTPLLIKMKSIAFELNEAVILAGKNPAHRIIKKAIENRHQNNPEKLNTFSCQTYNKFVYDFIPQKEAYQKHVEKKPPKNIRKRKQHQNLTNAMTKADSFHLLIWETITNKKFLSPGHYNEEVLYNRLSGLEEPNFVALAQDLQPFSFYGDQLNILEKKFVNPISPGSTRKYFFEIKDTLYQNQDSIFIIAFQPRKGKKIEALKGVLYIHTNGYAIQNVIAEPAEKAMLAIKFEQRYSFQQSHWFPEQLNFEVLMPKYPNKYLGMRIVGKSYISNVKINTPLEKKSFNNLAYTLGEDIYNKKDTIWKKYRIDTLKAKEILTYQRMDSIGKVKHLDRKINLLSALAVGRYPIGKIDIRADQIFRSNTYEDTRLGLGLQTNDKLSSFFSIGASAGYGFGDETWKYAANLDFHFQKNRTINLQFNYQNDLESPAKNPFNQLSESLVSNQFYDTQLDQIEKYSAVFDAELFKYAKVQFGLSHSERKPLYEYHFQDDLELTNQFSFTELGLSIRYSFGEQYIPAFGSKVLQKSDHPVFQLTYQRGIKGLLNGNYDYNKILFGVEHRFTTRGLGETSFRLESAWVDSEVPYAKLFVGSGIGGGFEILSIDNSFQTMQLQEFLSNRFVNIFVKHNFGAFLYRYKYSKPEFSIVQGIAYGSLTQQELHEGINFKTLENGYFESGLEIDNIIRIPYVNFAFIGLGFGTYYRYGSYALPNLNENLAYRLKLKLEL